jgi:hypothetical protein
LSQQQEKHWHQTTKAVVVATWQYGFETDGRISILFSICRRNLGPFGETG